MDPVKLNKKDESEFKRVKHEAADPRLQLV